MRERRLAERMAPQVARIRRIEPSLEPTGQS